MAQLGDQFKQAKQNIEPEKDANNAAKAHVDVRKVLESDEKLAVWGIDTILIGSYARHVSIKRVRDVDVFSRLPDLPDDILPGSLLDRFYDVLVQEYGNDRIERQDRSINVEFPDYDLSVDAVPARPKDDYWEIPDRNGGWEATNPEHLGELTSTMNDNHGDHYVPTVKLIRQVRRAHLGERPAGLYYEILTYHAFDEGIDAETAAEYFTRGLRDAADQLRRAIDQGGLDDPTLPGKHISTHATPTQLEDAYIELTQLASEAEKALASDDRCQAAKLYQEILGKTPDEEWVFPLPDDCDEDGRAKILPVITPGSRTIPPGDSRFA